MSNIKTRLHHARSKFLRRGSAASATRSIASAGSDSAQRPQPPRSNSLPKLSEASADAAHGPSEQRMVMSDVLGRASEPRAEPCPDKRDRRPSRPPASTSTTSTSARDLPNHVSVVRPTVTLTLEEPTPIRLPVLQPAKLARAGSVPDPSPASSAAVTETSDIQGTSPLPSATTATPTPPVPIHRQSVASSTDARLVKTLLPSTHPQPYMAPAEPQQTDYFGGAAPPAVGTMPHRKIWVKRPSASATLVQIRQDALVDDARDMILRKYANSLGRSFDSPDVTLRIVPRDGHGGPERTLGPEEDMCRTLDAYYPGAQAVAEALIIDVPHRRTPKTSPRLFYSHHADTHENPTEYFPPFSTVHPSPSILSTGHERIPLPHAPHSIAVINTGQLPPLPSPGGTRRKPLHSSRPAFPRNHTASPTTMTAGMPTSATGSRPPNRPRQGSNASDAKTSTTSNNPIPTPPAIFDPLVRQASLQTSNPPTPRVASPQPVKKRKKKAIPDGPAVSGLLDGSVPPINVLIVEDNIINLRVLGAFMQRLKVRWQRAMNGKEAVTKWKAGGFHLVLMDIQLPIMNGLEATKEIRRLERVNRIGIFSGGSKEAANKGGGKTALLPDELGENDKLGDRSLFKSPVIIVALTASSLQSDRHEALAAGCNDFLTKPVNFVWLERKVKEWGCMQALIDYDGWRKWKDFADQSENARATSKMSTSYISIAPAKKPSVSQSPKMAAGAERHMNGGPVRGDDEGSEKGSEKGSEREPSRDREGREGKERKKRRSLAMVLPPSLMEECETTSV